MGVEVGVDVGDFEGLFVGFIVGDKEGLKVGVRVGSLVGGFKTIGSIQSYFNNPQKKNAFLLQVSAQQSPLS